MKTLGMAILLALTSASFVMALGPWNSDTAQGAGELEAQGRAGGLMMRWEPPSTLPEEPLTGYQLRHRPQTTSQTPAWTTVDVGVVTNHRVSGLTDGTTYDVEVATRTAQGVGTFYASTTGTPGASQCESGTAVSDPANNPGLVEDCEVLLAARDTLAGTGTLNWSASTPVTSWEGVRVSRSPSRVTSLFLRYNGQLTGSIPVELVQLSNLTSLDLDGNQLTGSIPVELVQLSNLTSLALSRNELTGSIPVELGQLSNLQYLYLHGNELTGSIPVELGQLSNLMQLSLGGNELTGSIPVELGQLSNLMQLSLSSNELTGSIPVELGQLSNLTSLDLSSNELTGSIPVELGQLSNLRTLYLSNNQLTGSIPVELGQLSNLTRLSLSGNELTGSIPVELGQLSNLTWLFLSNNELTGTIPTELGNLTNLTNLDLRYNDLTGTIPTELGNLTNLTWLFLRSNDLTGTIPTELGNLTNLTDLSLGSNDLTGTIPTELGNLTNLTSLTMGSNDLTGTIPTELGNLTNLTLLELGSNDLTGTIPTELGNLTNLIYLYLGSNDLTGTIPTELGNLTNLTNLDLESNDLTGTIPTELGNLTNLIYLTLGSNDLTGTIPTELGNLTNLTWLDLESNDLTGTIPDDLAHEDFRWLNLGGNEFTGCVPPALTFAKGSDVSTLGLPDCPVVTITTTSAPGSEGASLSFTVARSGGTLSDVLTLSLNVAESGDMISGSAPSSVTIPSGETSATVTVATVNDTTPEADSVITAAIARDSGYARGSDSSAEVTVTDDDLPTVTIAANGSPISEGENASFTLTRTGDTTASLVVPVGVAETGATITGTPPASVTIPAGQASVNVTVATEDDTDPESDSTITATLTAGTAYRLGDDFSATVTVRDDDPLVSFMAPEAITEGENAVFTFERVGGVSHELEVSVSVLLTGDFLSGAAPTTVTFTADSTTAELSIPTVDDTTPEADGSIAVLLRQGVDYDITGTLLQQVSVQDNDRPTVTVAAVTTPIDEGGNAVFRVTATGGVILQALTVPVTVTESGAMITTGTPLPTLVTLTATQRWADISIPTEDDAVPEDDSVVTATLSAGTLYDLGDDSSEEVTVRDDDPLVSFMAPDDIIEGETAFFTFERVGGVSHELVVSVSVLPTGDFLSGPAPDSVTFAAGSTTVVRPIDTVDDSTPEADGSIAVLLRQGADYNVTGPLLQRVSVQDNDRPTVTVTAVATPLDEGGSAVFRVTATGGVILQALTVPVTVSESDAMITAGTPLPTLVTLTATQRWADISIPTEDDAVPEDDSVVTATLSAGTLYDLGDDSSAEGTVRDDDPLVSFMAPDDIIEGETAVFTFERVGGVSHELEVSVSVLPTGDFLSGAAPTTVTFTADSTTAELSIPTVDDSTPEADGSIAVLLRQGVDYDITGTLLQQVSVQDNDRPTVTIAAVTTPIDEGNAAVFRVTRTGGTITEALTVSVSVTETGSMISGTAPTSLTIAANQTSADLSVPTHEDKTAEVDSVVTATLLSGTTYDLGTTASAAVTVTDDDLPALTITFDDTSPIEEGTTASFTVTRTGVTSEALTINVSVLETGNMIDGTPPTTLVFAANEATADLNIDTDDDSVDEPDSTIYVGVTLPNERRSRTTPDLVSVVVTDND